MHAVHKRAQDASEMTRLTMDQSSPVLAPEGAMVSDRSRKQNLKEADIMRIVKCWIYKTYYIWLFDDGHYQVESIDNSFQTLKDAKKCIDHITHRKG